MERIWTSLVPPGEFLKDTELGLPPNKFSSPFIHWQVESILKNFLNPEFLLEILSQIFKASKLYIRASEELIPEIYYVMAMFSWDAPSKLVVIMCIF